MEFGETDMRDPRGKCAILTGGASGIVTGGASSIGFGIAGSEADIDAVGER